MRTPISKEIPQMSTRPNDLTDKIHSSPIFTAEIAECAEKKTKKLALWDFAK
jgi:hypothetical protein